jgi:hypothetical protein
MNQVMVYWSLLLKGAIVRVDPFQSFPTWVSYVVMTHYWLRNDHCAQYGSSLSRNTKLYDFKMSHDHQITIRHEIDSWMFTNESQVVKQQISITKNLST